MNSLNTTRRHGIETKIGASRLREELKLVDCCGGVKKGWCVWERKRRNGDEEEFLGKEMRIEYKYIPI